MTTLKGRLQADMKSALRAGEKARLSTIRMALAEITRHQADHGGTPDDDQVIVLIGKMIKQRRDSERQFRDGGRPELADQEAGEIEVLTAYLPQPLHDDEVAALVDTAVGETRAAGLRDMGKVMAWLKPKVAGRTDMGKLSGQVKARLSR